MIFMIVNNFAMNSNNIHLKLNRIIKFTGTKALAICNLQFRVAVTLTGISNIQRTADIILCLNLKI